ncbi:MAG: 2-amino-4-hydroxy-6-hydroxymethyldihydropteridine diphosphokinase [Woeseiaceae bacterium]|nr:2-amino-4-hydroxy-6-hydroxymethyldihydropteridine diphosphokinase [Woeseiaceae bacterium]
MATVYLGLGSNIAPEDNLHLGVAELRRRYGDIELSAVYRSHAVGFDGDDFLNLVARFESEESPLSICEEIEVIHNLAGRDRSGGKWEARSLDIDLLLYNDMVVDEPPVRVPRDDILEYSFVLRPLAELAPELVHPVTGKTMLDHWQAFDADSQPLEIVGVIL